MQRTWIERCDLHVRRNKELRDSKVHKELRHDLVNHLLSVMWLLRTNRPTCCGCLSMMKSGVFSLGGRDVKGKEGLIAGKTTSGVKSSCNTLSGINQDNVATKNSINAVTGEPSRKSVNFCTLIAPTGNGANVAYPIVDNYVKNTLSKYGLFKSMFNSSNKLFFFKFISNDGIDAMLENVWVKFHGVPMTTFSKDGLSSIATKLSTPLMLNSYTSDMFMHSWGRSSYARAMIELRADVELKDIMVVAMPILVAKNLNNYRQTTRGVLVGPNFSFKSTKQIYRLVSNKNGANASHKKKQAEVDKSCFGSVVKADVLLLWCMLARKLVQDKDSAFVEVVREGYLEVATGRNSMEYAYYTPLAYDFQI
ncbi:hypothetical protein Tco_1324419 [Tanacetum coccineum]